jgi:hypothetical protein
MFVRMCPYPFSARVCLNQHHWLADCMREEGISIVSTGSSSFNRRCISSTWRDRQAYFRIGLICHDDQQKTQTLHHRE